ncbi:MAG: ABC transporter permease [Dehalococcoidia bacterium]|nr:ABC transporter permease [Dehalococcoidia bacterium]
MRFWQLFLRNLKETYRDQLALGFLLAFPLLFMLVFGVALGANEAPSYRIAAVDDDASPISASFITEGLPQALTLEVELASSAADALASLKLGDIRAFVVIPPGFGEAVVAIRSGTPANLNLDLTYDESDLAVSGEIVQTVRAILGEFAAIESPITVNAHPVNTQAKITQIDFIAPGIIIFGLLIMIPTSARIMTRDKENGYLRRLLTTPTHPWEFILGYSLCLLLIAVIQIIFFLLIGWLFGMDILGNLALAFGVYVLAAIASIGLGMVVAALAKSQTQAEPLTWLFTMPLAIISGVWFSLGSMPSYIRAISQIFPYAHAVEATRAILLRGAGFTAVGSDLVFLVAWAVGAILLGIFMFGRTMRA